jgi:hypothetical protein
VNLKKCKYLRCLAFRATAKNPQPGAHQVIDAAHSCVVNAKGTTRAAYQQLKRMVKEHGYSTVVSEVGGHYGA